MSRPKMYATLLAAKGPIRIGDLVLVEVPDNCTVHVVDAARLARLRAAATALAAGLRDETSRDVLDQLALAVAVEADE